MPFCHLHIEHPPPPPPPPEAALTASCREVVHEAPDPPVPPFSIHGSRAGRCDWSDLWFNSELEAWTLAPPGPARASATDHGSPGWSLLPSQHRLRARLWLLHATAAGRSTSPATTPLTVEKEIQGSSWIAVGSCLPIQRSLRPQQELRLRADSMEAAKLHGCEDQHHFHGCMADTLVTIHKEIGLH